MKRNIVFLFLFTLGLSACTAASPTSMPSALTDSFFSGYAFVDANGNGQLDPADTPLKDAIFIVQLEGDLQFGALTDETGNAFVTIPAAVEYPVTLLMKAPEASALILIGPAKIILQESASEKASFLFVSK